MQKQTYIRYLLAQKHERDKIDVMEEWVLQKVLQNFNGELITNDQAREAMSIDASIFKVKPAGIAVPREIEGLKTLVRNVADLAQQGVPVSLTPRAAGTCMSGGSLTSSILVDMRPGFNWIGDVDHHEKSVWVGAGTHYRDLEQVLAPMGLLFAPYPSSKDMCTIGGMAGNNASGEKSIRYGTTADNIISLRMVCHDGNEYEFSSLDAEGFNRKIRQDNFEGYVYRELDKLIEDKWEALQKARPKVRKNAAGYQLWKVVNKDQDDFNVAKMLVGTQGTLGFITAIKLRLVQSFSHRRMLVVPVGDLSRLAEAVQTVLLHHPDSLETYDHHTYELAEKFMPEEAMHARASKGHHMMLMAQFVEHTKDQTDHYAEVCQKALEKKHFKVHYVARDTEAEAHWRIRRASYQLLKDHPYGGMRAAPFIEDTIVPVEHYGEFLAAWEAILAEYSMTYTYAGHIGEGSIRLIPLVDMTRDSVEEQIFDLARRTYDLVFAFGGSMSADHNDGIVRTPFLERMYGPEIMEVFAQIKELFDPLTIFNPGKKMGLGLEYAKEHLLRTNE